MTFSEALEHCEYCKKSQKHGYKYCNNHGIQWYKENTKEKPKEYKQEIAEK